MKKIFLLLSLLIACNVAAQTHQLSTLRLEARGDYQRFYVDATSVKENTGFKGKFLNVRLDGQIGENLTYSYRQRLNKPHKDASFFDATD